MTFGPVWLLKTVTLRTVVLVALATLLIQKRSAGIDRLRSAMGLTTGGLGVLLRRFFLWCTRLKTPVVGAVNM